MNQHLSLVSLVDYGEAIAFFTGALDFELCEDTPLGGGKRWVVVRPSGGAGTGLLLRRASRFVGDHKAAGGLIKLRTCIPLKSRYEMEPIYDGRGVLGPSLAEIDW